ncbi:MAG TPA: threonine/serine exporter family protein, partial [Spirochaetia bacterium]|nr:threonine/serine exporter family protein [Spirochaetia bacterium]
TVFIVSAIIPLVPGGGMYYTMMESIRGNIDGALSFGFETVSIAGAIAAGLAIASSLIRLVSKNRQG